MNNRALSSIFMGILILLLGAMCVPKDQRSASGDSSSTVDTNDLVNRIDDDRDALLVNTTASDITKAEWTNATGRKETLSKEDQIWHYAGMEALDAAKSEEYFQQLSKLKGSRSTISADSASLVMKENLTLYGINMISPVELTAFAHPDSSHLFLIHSSDNPGFMFISDSSGIYQQIFGDLRQFWPDGQ